MKSLEEFREFYEKSLKKELEPLELERIAINNKKTGYIKALILVLFAIVAMITPLVITQIIPKDWYPFLGIIGVAYIFICFLALFPTYEGYNIEFKRIVIGNMVKFLGDDLEYFYNQNISLFEFDNAGLFTDKINNYKGEDLIRGIIHDEKYEKEMGKEKGTKIEFSEVDAKIEETYTDDNGITYTKQIPVFKGLFFRGEFNKNFSSKLLVVPSTYKPKLQKDLSRIKLEDVEFQKLFCTYGSDQHEARYILSPSLMKRLVEYVKKNKKWVAISFVESSIYVAIPYGKNLFECNIKKSLLDFEEIKGYYQDLQLAVSIVEELNLNYRIWTKE